MSGYDLFLLSIAVGASAYASYTDMKYRKVKNLCSFGLIYAGLISQGIFVYLGQIGIWRAVSTCATGILISFLLFWFGILGAGDVKLLLGLSLIIPPSVLDSRFGDSPPLVLFVNIFGLYFFGILFYLLVKTSWSQKWNVFLHAVRPSLSHEALSKGISGFILFLGFGYLVSYIFWRFRIPVDSFLRFLLIIFLFPMIDEQLKKRKGTKKFRDKVLIPVSFLFIFLSSRSIMETAMTLVILCLIWIIIFPVMRIFIMALEGMIGDRDVQISDLREGMIPAEQIVKVEKEEGIHYEKRDFALPNPLKGEVILAPFPGGITKDQIEELKKLAEEGHFEGFGNKIRIQGSVRFAPIITVGFLLTIICRGPFYARIASIMFG
jgi:Flp pilus assembly protein protease CpaA